MDIFLDDLPQPALDTADEIHGAVTQFHLPTLFSPLLLLQDVGPGYPSSRECISVDEDVVAKHGLQGKPLRIT
jgi:hypothetical protein